MEQSKVIVLAGPESSGKTTLAQQLANHFQTAWHPEFLRVYLNMKSAYCPGFHLAQVPLISQVEAEHLAFAQMACEQTFLTQHQYLYLFLDTDLLMNYVYFKVYFGTPPFWMEQVIQNGMDRHYLLQAPDLPWQPDPQREGPQVQEQIFDEVAKLLNKWRLPFSLVDGSGPERLQKAVRAVTMPYPR